MDHRKPRAVLAGKAVGIQRGERVIRQDLVEREDLMTVAASFLVQRAFDKQLLVHDDYLMLRAIIALCDPPPQEVTTSHDRSVRGGLFMAACLHEEILDAIRTETRLRTETLRVVGAAVRGVVEAARSRANKAGVVDAYIDYVRKHAPPVEMAERRARERAFARARKLLGTTIPQALTIDYEFYQNRHYHTELS